MSTLHAVACVWLGEPPWDLTGERAVRAAATLRNIPVNEPPEHDLQLRGSASYQRIAVDAVQQFAKATIDELGLREIARGPEADQVVAGIDIEIRTRVLLALTPEDIPAAVDDDNMMGYVIQAAQLAIKPQIEATRALLEPPPEGA